MSDPILRPYRDSDLRALVAINDGAFPAVPITPVSDFAELVEMSSVRIVVEQDGVPVGFVLGMPPGLAYESENYTFFSARSQDFVWVDRIVLAPAARSRGIGPLLYDAVVEEARRTGASEVLCEVNVEPPNPGSLAFHARLGFHEIGRQQTHGGENTVALLALDVTA